MIALAHLRHACRSTLQLSAGCAVLFDRWKKESQFRQTNPKGLPVIKNTTALEDKSVTFPQFLNFIFQMRMETLVWDL